MADTIYRWRDMFGDYRYGRQPPSRGTPSEEVIVTTVEDDARFIDRIVRATITAMGHHPDDPVDAGRSLRDMVLERIGSANVTSGGSDAAQ